MTTITLHTPEGTREIKPGEKVYSIDRLHEYFVPTLYRVEMRADFTGYRLAKKATGLQSRTREQAEADQREVCGDEPVYFQASKFEISTK